MAATTVYTNFRSRLGSKAESLSADSFKAALFTSSYTPSQTGDIAYSVPPPPAASLSQGGSGGPAARTEYYVLTNVNSAGESTGSTEASISVAAGSLTTVASPTNPGGSCTGYNVYASTTSGAETLQNSSPIPYGTNWTEQSAGLSTTGKKVSSTNTAQISGEVATGNGYTAGGVLLTSVTWSAVAANKWPDTWKPEASFNAGQIVSPATANGFLYLCLQTGTSGASAPAWGTSLYSLTTDNTVSWLCVGSSFVVFNAADLSWSVQASFPYRYVVIYDASTYDLVCYIDAGANLNGPSNGTIQVSFDPAGIFAM